MTIRARTAFRLRALAAAALLLALAASAAAAGGRAQAGRSMAIPCRARSTSASPAALKVELICLVQQGRRQAGLRPLLVSPALQAGTRAAYGIVAACLRKTHGAIESCPTPAGSVWANGYRGRVETSFSWAHGLPDGPRAMLANWRARSGALWLHQDARAYGIGFYPAPDASFLLLFFSIGF